jgi:hypothetical protein
MPESKIAIFNSSEMTGNIFKGKFMLIVWGWAVFQIELSSAEFDLWGKRQGIRSFEKIGSLVFKVVQEVEGHPEFNLE